MPLLKEQNDSFALSMSLAEMAFLIVFVLLLVTTLSNNEDVQGQVPEDEAQEIPPDGGGANPAPDPTQVNTTDREPPASDGGGELDTNLAPQSQVPEDEAQEIPPDGGGANPAPDPTQVNTTDREPPDGDGANRAPDPTQVNTPDGEPPASDGGGGESTQGEPPEESGERPTPDVTPGVGPDACWRDADGNIEYLYNIVFQEDGLDVEQAWPSRRDMEADEINARELLGEGVRIEEFRPGAQQILIWSDDQDPPCRHYFYTHVDDVNNYRLLRNVRNYLYSEEDESSRN